MAALVPAGLVKVVLVTVGLVELEAFTYEMVTLAD